MRPKPVFIFFFVLAALGGGTATHDKGVQVS